MAPWTLEQARQHLEAWMAADLALATGKEYTMGSRRLTRADALEIKERIAYWSSQVQQLTGQGRRTRRVIPLG